MQISSTTTLTLATLAALGLAATRPVAAQGTNFTTNVTINYAVGGSAEVGMDSNGNTSDPVTHRPYNPSVSLVSGGSIGGNLYVYNSSTVNVSGGSVAGYLQIYDSSTATVSGGTFGQFFGANFFDDTTGTGTFTFVGTGLGETALGSDGDGAGGMDYALSGSLTSGASVTGDVVDVARGANKFTLSNVSAAPEPSQTAALGLGVLGLSGLILRGRKRRAA